jgi:hypothetical protein
VEDRIDPKDTHGHLRRSRGDVKVPSLLKVPRSSPPRREPNPLKISIFL